MSANEAWEDVLAAVEADVALTERMFVPQSDVRRELGYAETVLPKRVEYGLPRDYLELPRLEDMPAVPEEMRERIHDLRLRITALQMQLCAELADLRTVQTGPLARAATRHPLVASGVPAHYLDCTA